MKKHTVSIKALLAVVAAGVFMLASSASADTTYTYAGNTLFGSACSGCTIDGSFTVAANPFLTGPFGETFQPESYDFTVDGVDFNNTNSNDGSGFFVVTDSSGDITNWVINLTNSNGDVFSADTWYGDEDSFTDNTGRRSQNSVNLGNPGDWTQNDPPSNTPEPSSLLLLSSGLAGLGFFKRKAVQS